MQLSKIYLLYLFCFISSNMFSQNTAPRAHDEDLSYCCPDGWDYVNGNCDSGLVVPPGYRYFIYNGQFYVTQNCVISNENDCCPPGYSFDGQNCYSAVSVPDGYDIHIINGTIQVAPECCECPEGSVYDGENCATGVSVPDNVHYFAYQNHFYVRQDCKQFSQANDCCPPGYTFDGQNCFSWQRVKDGWFVQDGMLFNEANCKIVPSSEEQLCDIITNVSGDGDFNRTFEMGVAGTTDICFNPHCVPDELIIKINGQVVVDTDSYTNGCWLGLTCNPNTSNCDQPINYGCNVFNPWTCFTIQWEDDDVIEISVNGNTCNETGTYWELKCEGGDGLIGDTGTESRSQGAPKATVYRSSTDDSIISISEEELDIELNVSLLDKGVRLANLSAFKFNYSIYNSSGIETSRGSLTSGGAKNIQIPVAGIYLVQFENNQGFSITEKIVIK